MERLPSDDMREIDISVDSTDIATKSRRESFIDGIKDIQESMNDQDFKQKTSAYLTFGLEMYRVVMGTLLLLFVPQKCDRIFVEQTIKGVFPLRRDTFPIQM